MSTLENRDVAFHAPWKPDSDPQRPLPLDWTVYSDAVMSEWYQLLGRDPEEKEIQKFLELHPAMIPGGSGDVGPGGHHGSQMSAVFSEPSLQGSGPSFEPDFVWVTRSSGLITPILIEIEKPSKRWFRQNGRPTAEFTQARDQLNEWRSWFARDTNKSLFREKFLFEDFFRDLPLEPQFVLIYGRRSEFEHGGGHENPSALIRKRDSQRGSNESFMTFDSLRPRYDHSHSVTVALRSAGPRPIAFSPVYGTSANSGSDALILGDPSEALDRSVMMTDERKRYLAQRWDYWKEREIQHKKQGKFHARSMGRE